MGNVRNYKASFILDMRGYSDPLDTILDKLRTTVSDLGGNIGDFKNLGRKDFQRTVDKKYLAGEYIQIFFSSDPSVPASIKNKLKLDKTINRIFIETIN